LSVIPGILQTTDYAEHLLRGIPPTKTDDQIRRLIEIRERRKELLHDRNSSTRLITVIDEAAVHRRVGSDEITRNQLEQLYKLSEQRNITIQIMPFDAGVHAGLMGMFTVFQFADDIDRDIVSIETHSGDRYLEEQSSVLEFLRMFDSVSHRALDTASSRDLLADVMSHLSSPKGIR